MMKTPRLSERKIPPRGESPRKTGERKSPERKRLEAVEKFRDARQDRFLSALSPNLNVMIKAVQKAGRNLMRDFGEIENLQISRKGAADFVSNADTYAEKTIREYLKEARPRYGFLQEESGEVKGEDTSHRWIVDPLDGTMNFLHGIGHFAISLALQEDKEIVAGVIYNPATGELFYAEKGKGAWAMAGGTGRRLRVSNRGDLTEAVVVTGIPHKGHSNPERFIKQLTPMMENTGGVRRMGSAALDLAYVAAGKFEAYWEEDIKPWDIAAGLLLVKEAGGHVSTFSGKEKTDEILADGSILAVNDSLCSLFQRMFKNSVK